jgi:large subunit ribosomal protein L5
MNPMRNIKIEKLTLNIGVGKNPQLLDKAMTLLKKLANAKPVKTYTQKRIAGWGLRPGLPIGCKVTLRGENASELLMRLLQSKDDGLIEKQFDDFGNIAFGIPEYINIPGIEYDPNIGIIGLEACVTLERPGFRVKKRKNEKRKIPKKHGIPKEDAINFMKNEFKIKVGEV